MHPRTRSKLASFLFYVPFGLRMWKLFKGTGTALADLRRDYRLAGLTEAELAADPIQQFERWFAEGVSTGLEEKKMGIKGSNRTR